jgi:hypothetical protein
MNLNIKDEVKRLLTFYPKLRDDDRALIAKIWGTEAEGLYGIPEFLEAFTGGAFTNPESIRRSRAALQVKHPNLRGELWEARHEAEAPIIDALNDIKNEPPFFQNELFEDLSERFKIR